MVIKLEEEVAGRYVQYKCTSHYGKACALQYISVESCFTEEDTQYKIENIDGMTNLNADVKDKQKASVEECRTYCRHVDTHTLKLHESQYRVTGQDVAQQTGGN